MPRISQLPSLTSADNADEIAIVDVSASATKRITRGDLLKSPLPTNSVTTAAVTNGAITADKLDFTTFARVVEVSFSNFLNLTNTSDQDYQSLTATGLVPGWTYLVLVNVGMMTTAGGATGLLAVTNIGMPGGRIRAGTAQSSPSWSTVLAVTSTSLTMALRGRVTASGMDIEQTIVKFIPLYKTA